MEKFILLIKGGSPDEANRDEYKAKCDAWKDSLKEKGIFDSMGSFEEKGKNIVGADMSVSDYEAEVGGYFVLNADDMDTAVEIAKDAPSLAQGGSIGVHRIQKMDR